MSQNFQEVLSNFSQKLARFNKSSQTERAVPPSKNSYYEEKLRERGEKFRASVLSTYKIYRAPFEALGEQSDRAASIDKDEQALLKAYNLYKSCMDIDKENQDEIGSTHIKNVELYSPLADKASYTQGGQFIYLLCWLYFEQNSTEFMPFFKEIENHTVLCFSPSEDFHFDDSHEREIFELIEAEFYS
ncbi:MAG: hypothetical protein IJ207_00945 [Treponema sp.]|uniref:hypothetical protein n=1 Tax=Treponema sp. TaxID=166 RepID=UPI0025FB4DF3|nr:hypothetical protein [Treponema sp.]MBQ9280751.1 hypothetical protein [Treponema sp.]